MFKYFPHTEADLQHMKRVLGITNTEDMFQVIPQAVRHNQDYLIPSALPESDLRRHMEELGKMNAQKIIFSGLGAYDHYEPSVINAIISRQEFLTSYTPYQPEISQGTLTYIFEYQSMITSLTGMEVSNASMYDGPTATAEAMFMAEAITRRNILLMSSTVNPNIQRVVQTYAKYKGLSIEIVDQKDGVINLESLKSKLNDTIAGVIVQNPNFFGIIEDYNGFSDAIHANGSIFIINSDISTLGVLKTPGSYNADIAVGDCQSLGMPVAFGGPYLGYLATKKSHVRKMPGRICGQSFDRNGKRSFVLTLQAREQHIRREKANSNICSNQSLLALYATVYLSLLGPKGLREVNELSYQGAHYLYDELLKTGKFTPVYDKPFLKEFILHTHLNVNLIAKILSDHGIFGGVNLEHYNPEFQNVLNFCVTEKRNKIEIDRLVSLLGGLS
jgi:glycine dehydrogenase subunit 1